LFPSMLVNLRAITLPFVLFVSFVVCCSLVEFPPPVHHQRYEKVEKCFPVRHCN
jgi:hypothetical protein